MAGQPEGSTEEFQELTYAEQARSIAATINDLEVEIEHHVEHSPQPVKTIEVSLSQVDRLRQRLRASYDQRASHANSAAVPLRSEEMPRLRVGSPRLADPVRAADFTMEVADITGK